MKTQNQIRNEIRSIDNKLYSSKEMIDQKTLTALSKEKANLLFLKMYLETNPTEEQVKRQLQQVTREIELKESRFAAWNMNAGKAFETQVKAKAHYEKINDLPRLRTQQTTLQYLLSWAMEKMKTHVLTVSRTFPAKHPRKGDKTFFIEKIKSARLIQPYVKVFLPKIHTIRANYPLWEKRIKEVQEGKAVLSLRYWSEKPYRSKQIEFARIDKDSGVGIQQFFMWTFSPLVDGFTVDPNEICQNDGLSLDDFKSWFKGYDLSKPLAIIHFTHFRYWAMTIDFFQDNEQKAATVENYLFSANYAQIMCLQFIYEQGKVFHVNSLHNTDKKHTLHAFIVEVPNFRSSTNENF